MRFFPLWLLTFFSIGKIAGTLIASNFEEDFLKIFVHNVGQGNCVVAQLYEDKESQYLLIDAGSASYKKELLYNETHLKNLTLSSTVQEKEPKSEKKRRDPDVMSNIPQKKQEKLIQDKIKSIRESLGEEKRGGIPSISVTTVFISHPDEDHYNWIQKIFSSPEDEICNIILGGLPEHYNNDFRTWLQSWSEKSSIYFPAIFYKQPLTNIDDIMPSSQRQYAGQLFSDPVSGKIQGAFEHLENFQTAIPWENKIKTYLLTVNPTHYKEEGIEEVARSCLEGDKNSDSLVVRLKMDDSSIDILGDATNITTNRIIRNYKGKGFLNNTTITVAAHHGSSSHGSNNAIWIQETSPFYVIFSCGIEKNKHPKLQTYEAYRKSTNIISMTPSHKLWVWEKIHPGKKERKINKKGVKQEKEEKLEEGVKAYEHTTSKALFSTFNEGTIQIKFCNKLVEFEGQQEYNEIIFELEGEDEEIPLELEGKGEDETKTELTSKEINSYLKKSLRDKKQEAPTDPLTPLKSEAKKFLLPEGSDLIERGAKNEKKNKDKKNKKD